MANQKQQVIARTYSKQGRLISIGVNSYSKTHPHQAALAKKAGLPDKVYLHAEVLALLRAQGKNLKVHKLVIKRYKRDGTPGNAKPCPVCEEAIRLAGVKVVEYTTGD